MPLVAAYHRPDNVPEALALLAEPRRVPLGGGTVLNADRDASALELVDLQDLGLNGIEATADRAEIGAMTTLQSVHDHFGPSTMLGELARAEAPSTLRTLATIGGSIASASAESAFVAALLVHEAVVRFADGADRSLADVLASGVTNGALIVALSVSTTGQTSHAATGRTPADTPIVAATARRTSAGIALALSGVAPTPLLVDPTNPAAGLAPVGDFRGSAAYRLDVATTLSARVIGALQ